MTDRMESVDKIARIIATELGVTFDINSEPLAMGEIADREDCLRIAKCIVADLRNASDLMQWIRSRR